MPGIDELASIILFLCVHSIERRFLRYLKKIITSIFPFFANDTSTLMTLLPYVMKQFCIKMDDVSKYVIFIDVYAITRIL